jgi:succinate dehydrogenase / fumarate reductase membrane anchor subunit
MKKEDSSDLRSKLSKARGLGSAKHGVSHWWLQRVTAIAMIPLFIWFITAIVSVMIAPEQKQVANWFVSPVNALLLVLLVCAMFYHAKLGLQVVIEDYIKCPYTKYGLLIGNSFFCIAGAAVCILAVFKLHLFIQFFKIG